MNEMLPGKNDVELVLWKLSWILIDKGLDQVQVLEECVTDLKASRWWHGRKSIGVGGTVGDYLESLIHEEQQRPLEVEKYADIV
ncbi:MAG: hypothetical protein ACHRHE_03140 [Tepidisphaerales bacterium]